MTTLHMSFLVRQRYETKYYEPLNLRHRGKETDIRRHHRSHHGDNGNRPRYSRYMTTEYHAS